MKTLYFTIGIPGSGKSTWVKNNPELYDALICPDSIRMELAGDEGDQSRDWQVWRVAYLRLEEYFILYDRIMFDSTMCNPKTMGELIARAKAFGAERIEAVRINCPLEIAIGRNANRGRKVPEDIIRKMFNAKKKLSYEWVDYIGDISTAPIVSMDKAYDIGDKDVAWGEAGHELKY